MSGCFFSETRCINKKYVGPIWAPHQLHKQAYFYWIAIASSRPTGILAHVQKLAILIPILRVLFPFPFLAYLSSYSHGIPMGI